MEYMIEASSWTQQPSQWPECEAASRLENLSEAQPWLSKSQPWLQSVFQHIQDLPHAQFPGPSGYSSLINQIHS
jgi:hypothetical protein